MRSLGVLAPTHTPVLVREVIEALAVQPGGRYIDCTVGGGGHAIAILENSSPGGQLLGLDADPDAIVVARVRLKAYCETTLLRNENFANLLSIAEEHGFYPVNGILFDLGLSSFQLSSDARGFSFQRESALDMRLSPEQEATAEDIINQLPETELAHLIRTYGEETYSHKIAHRIVEERPIKTTLQLARTIELAVGGRRGKIHPATKTFQALRIVVNRELQYLEAGLEQALGLLGFGGRLVVISYHSLEDRIVKQFTQRESSDCICTPDIPVCICGHKASLSLVNKRVITPTADEVQLNPRSRSAKLRAAERITEWNNPTGVTNGQDSGLAGTMRFSEN
ncbi:MAG: 16S rRNA (cytosine(1402)-N(4))-methyltransferase RsmH [Dehalococcoidales bacterium]|nr:MAG: 16S rRNA (cytosine(1402)-N(4))-methyltransferase RsmH [Dehalococcoidales bacterium]